MAHDPHPFQVHTRRHDDRANSPHEAILSTSLGDGAVDGITRVLVELVDARVEAAGDVERCGAVEILAGVVVDVSEEAVRVKGSFYVGVG